jgi:hypothetical protein
LGSNGEVSGSFSLIFGKQRPLKTLEFFDGNFVKREIGDGRRSVQHGAQRLAKGIVPCSASLGAAAPRARVSVSDMVITLASIERGVTCIGSFKNSAPNFSPGPLQ